MNAISSMMYVSSGNLPSQLASSGQIAKMSQAFAQQVSQFELVTSGDLHSWLHSWLHGMDTAFQSWYNLRHPFSLVRIPVHIRQSDPVAQHYQNYRYQKWAAAYAYVRSPQLLYTRTPFIANLLLSYGASVMWEWHEHLPEQHYSLIHHPNLLGLVTTLPQLAEDFRQQGVPGAKICVAANAADLESLTQPLSVSQCQTDLRQQLTLPATDPIVLYSGHLYDYKGIPTVLDTAALLPTCQFVLVGGWATDVERVTAQCQERSLQNVHLVGHVPQSELAPYLYAADIVLLPTSRSWALANTTCPLKLFDYMAVQKPIVASALPTIQTLLSDHHNALLVEPDNPHAFQQAILTLLQAPDLATAITRQAFQDVQQFTWDNRAAQILQFAAERLAIHSPVPPPLLKKLVRGVKLLL